MTPRALLTAIGATALAFTIAIGVAAESTSGVATNVAPRAIALEAASPSNAEATDARLAAWNAPCEIAV